ncbi:MAG: response regulator [Oligoflexia bacterium]|nr:response regulator [Oligoflexia bacterium]
MSGKKTINTKQLVDKIEKMTKEKITKEKVVSLADYRNLKQKEVPKTILIVDDDETMRQALKRLFEGEGYRVRLAADGTQLSQVLEEGPIELIVLDIGLPWINGFELAKLLKENEELKKIPLVFISAKTSEFDVKRGFNVGADDYIKKPFDVDEVKNTVKTLLKLR